MGLFGPSVDLSFDTEEMELCAGNYHEISGELSDMKKELCALLDDLKNRGWTTDAGKAFSEMVAVDWGDTIDLYCDMLNTLSEILKQAAGKYEALATTEAEAIKVLS